MEQKNSQEQNSAFFDRQQQHCSQIAVILLKIFYNALEGATFLYPHLASCWIIYSQVLSVCECCNYKWKGIGRVRILVDKIHNQVCDRANFLDLKLSFGWNKLTNDTAQTLFLEL